MGSIPAWAGETASYCSVIVLPPVYPRVGGGNACLWCSRTRCSGLSPRGRGKLNLVLLTHASTRSIPAWAGETYTPSHPPFV